MFRKTVMVFADSRYSIIAETGLAMIAGIGAFYCARCDGVRVSDGTVQHDILTYVCPVCGDLVEARKCNLPTYYKP